MSQLTEHQWEIATPDNSLHLTFGTLGTGVQTTHAPDLGETRVRSASTALPREDGQGFGPEYLDGSLLTFEANVVTDTHAEQSDTLAALRGAWSNEAFRESPGAYAILRCCVAGRLRRCYGRPRRFAEVDGDLTHEGYTGALFDFATMDGRFYDEQEFTKEISLVPESTGGMTDPLTDPLTVGTTGLRYGEIVVNGERTWVAVTIYGPVSNPVVDFGDFSVGLQGSIAAGESVIIDPRPWSRGVFRSDGASMAGRLTWATPPLRTLKMKPGKYLVSYRGTDDTGTSKCVLSWRPAYARP